MLVSMHLLDPLPVRLRQRRHRRRQPGIVEQQVDVAPWRRQLGEAFDRIAVAHVDLERQEGIAELVRQRAQPIRRAGRCRSPASRRDANRLAAASPKPAVAPVIRIVLLIASPRVCRGSSRSRSASRRSAHAACSAWGTARGDARLRDHVQPPDLRGMLGDGRVMHRQIVDEDRARRPPSSTSFLTGVPLPPLLQMTSCRMPWLASWSTRQGCASLPRLVRMTMSATSPIRPSASTAPGTSVWRCISPRKKASSRIQAWSSASGSPVSTTGHRVGEAARLEREADVCSASSHSAKWLTMCSSTSSQSVISSGRFNASSSSRAATRSCRLRANRLRDVDQVGFMRFEETEQRRKQGTARLPGDADRLCRFRTGPGTAARGVRPSVWRQARRARASQRHLSSELAWLKSSARDEWGKFGWPRS